MGILSAECYTTALSMLWGHGLIHGTKRHKDSQAKKKWITSIKHNIQSSFDNRLKAQKLWGDNVFLSTWYQNTTKYKSNVTLMIETITLQQTRRFT